MSTSRRLTPVLSDRLRQLLTSRGWPRVLALRRLTAGALVLLAAVLALRPPPAGGGPAGQLLVAARDLAPGVPLTAADVRVVVAPDALRPAAALTSPVEVTGRALAGPAGAGEAITGGRLLGPENTRLTTGGSGDVAVPVRLADPAVADLLAPGARVDVITVDPHGTSGALLASNATIVAVPAEPDRASGAAGASGRLVVIAMPPEPATRVASASLGQPVTVTLR
ncbi:MAG: SAF domain-containing protein [Labedaea sp.]